MMQNVPSTAFGYYLTVADGSSITRECIICGLKLYTVSNPGYFAAGVHFAVHSKGVFIQEQGGLIMKFPAIDFNDCKVKAIKEYLVDVGANNLSYIFPQLTFLNPISKRKFHIDVAIMLGGGCEAIALRAVKRPQSNEAYKVKFGSINDVFGAGMRGYSRDEETMDKKFEIIDFLINESYKCAFMIDGGSSSACGLVYESGMPSCETVANHLIRCHSNSRANALSRI